MGVPQLARRALFRAAKWAVPKPLYPSSLLRRKVRRATRQVVRSGPFAGMRYIDRSVWGAYVPKLIGCYELELHPYLERLVARKPSHLVDIGGAEGYYAVGLLHRLREARLTVYEQLADARGAIAELAAKNGVTSRLSIQGSCSPALLAECLQNGAEAVISDVEGYEVELFDEACVRALAGACLLIEVHDSKVPDCARIVTERFEPTHRVERILQRPRSLDEYPYADAARLFAPGWITKYALNEFRSPENSWLWIEPR